MRKSEVVLSVALLGSAAASVWLWGELRAERARSADLSARLDTATATPVAMPEPAVIPQAGQSVDTSPKALTPTSAEPVVTQSPMRVLGARHDERAYQRQLMRDPKYREAWRAQQRLTLTPRRANLIRLLGLSPDQADAVIDLSIERRIGWIERTPPDTMTVEYVQQQQEREEAEERADRDRLRELLGETQRARLQEYVESRPSRMQVDRFRTQLAGADALRDDQVEPLIAALHVEQSQMNQELSEYGDALNRDGDASDSRRRYGERKSELLKAAHGRMHAAAGAILSRTQLEALDALLRRDLERHEREQRLIGLESKLPRASGPVAN
jgi:hypothetical protein